MFGVSAGLVTSITLVPDMYFRVAVNILVKLLVYCRSFTLGLFSARLRVLDVLDAALREYLPTDAHLRSCGKLFISVTRATTLRNEVFNKYESRDELIEVMLASFFVPVIAGLIPPKLRGIRYIDGGFSDNLPVQDENTITVSPFACGACIKPKSYLSDSIFSPDNVVRVLKGNCPPSPEAFEDLL